jgi:hypothetical protein
MLSGLNKFYNFSLDFLTFSYSKYRLIAFSIVLFFLWVTPLKFLENMPNLSICSRFFGKYCYSVGITRGVSSLLKGNFQMSIEYNFLSVFVLGFLVGFVIYDLLKIFGNLRKKN